MTTPLQDAIAQAQAYLATAAQLAVPAPPVVPPGTPVDYATLPGATFAAKLAASTALIGIAAGNYTFNDFTAVGGLYSVDTLCKGLIGAGIDATLFGMAVKSSTKASPTTGTNPYTLMRFSAAGLLLQDFTLLGTAQQNLYNGLRLNGIAKATLRRLKILAIPGNDHVPPGETFAVNAYNCSAHVWDTVEVDGMGSGASGLATNTYSGGLLCTDCSSHDNRYSAGVALWQHQGGASFIRFNTQRNYTGASLERCTGMFTFTEPTFGGNTAQDLFVGNDQSADCQVVITDPAFTNGQTKLRVAVHPTEQGNPNKLTKANVKVLVDGVDKTTSMVTWV